MANVAPIQDFDAAIPCEAQACVEDTSTNQAYKQLIIDVAANLTQNDIDLLSFRQDIQTGSFETGIKLLGYLEQRNKIGPQKLSDLSEMLKAIHREDLATKMIEPFLQKQNTPSRRPFSFDGLEENRIHTNTSFIENYGPDSTVGLSQTSSTPSLIQQETGDPSLSQQHISISPPHERNRYEYVYSSTPSGSSIGYDFVDETNQHTRSQETSHSEIGLTDYSAEMISSGYSLSPSHKTTGLNLQSLASYSSSSPSASDVSQNLPLVSNNSHLQFDHQLSSKQLTHLQAVQQKISRSQSFSSRSTPPRRKSASNSVAMKGDIWQNRPSDSTADHDVFFQPPLQHQQEKLFHEPHKNSSRNNYQEMDQVNSSPSDTYNSQISSYNNSSQRSQLPVTVSRTQDTREQAEVVKQQPEKEPALLGMSCNTKLIDGASQSSGSNTLVSVITPTTSNSEATPVSIEDNSSSFGESFNEHCTINKLTAEMVPSLQEDGLQLVPKENVTTTATKQAKSTTRNCLKWSVNRLKLNKTIYKHEENATFDCKKKLEVDVGNGNTLNPKLSLILYPCGLEQDAENNVTLVIRVSTSKKAPPLKESTSIVLLIKVMEGDGDCELLNDTACEVNLNTHFVRKFGIISHNALKNSRSETIDFEAKIVEL